MSAPTGPLLLSNHVPILLLKTKSSPGDGYDDIFSLPHHGHTFDPCFVPVLEHRFEPDGVAEVESILRSRKIGKHAEAPIGGLIFTSQRAVEAFTKIVQDGQDGHQQWPYLHDVPVYSVGPATTRALKAVSHDPPLQVYGEHTGNGDNLAHFILEHYASWYHDRPGALPSLLFLVGEQRRDIIPKTLMDANLPKEKRIQVDEIVVYGSEVMKSFSQDFARRLRETQTRDMVWIVVFSPTGCDQMLKGLGMLDEPTGKAKPKDPSRTRFIATIGPTTRNYLKKTFEFDADVCAEKPSPEGVLEAITHFMSVRR